jgi:hypothetical protein
MATATAGEETLPPGHPVPVNLRHLFTLFTRCGPVAGRVADRAV